MKHKEHRGKRFPSGIMGTVCIPWDSNYRLNEKIFRRTIDKCRELTDLLYVGGTAGEGYALDTKSSSRLFMAAGDQVPPDAPIERIMRLKELVKEHRKY